MKLATFKQWGSPEVIEVVDLPLEQLKNQQGPNDVLVKVQATTVNHVDTYIRQGIFKTELAEPAILGRDLVGTVVETGAAAVDFPVGTAVWANALGYEGRLGAAAEYTLVPADYLYKLPAQVDPLALGTSVHMAATASMILEEKCQVQAGESILIEGAAGHVGKCLTELAAHLGLAVTTTSNVADFKMLTALGAQQTLDYHEELVGSYDYIIDTSGKVALSDNFEHLLPHGEVILITAPQADTFTFEVKTFYMQSQTLSGFVLSRATQAELQRTATRLNAHFAAGRLLTKQIKWWDLADIKAAHQALEAGKYHKKRFVVEVNK